MSKLGLKHDTETVTISKKEYEELRETKTFIDDSELLKLAETLQDVVDKLRRWYHQ